ncbi:MAG TPA: ParA family protein [Solirubrobacteraceae bacterium]|jgi:chromosome partitioning protein
MGRIVVFANQKGGVSKTTSVANLGPALVERNFRVLLVDADPQMNLTEAFGAQDEPGTRLEDVLQNPHRGASGAIMRERDGETMPGGVHLMPCTADLADVVNEISEHDGYEQRLRDLLRPLLDIAYDFVLIDTPPGLGVLSGLALIACDDVIVPARPSTFDLNGVVKMVDLIEEQLAEINPTARLLGALIVQRDKRWRSRRRAHEALDMLDIPRLTAEIPMVVRVADAPAYGRPTIVLEPDSRVAEAYREVAAIVAGAAEQVVA